MVSRSFNAALVGALIALTVAVTPASAARVTTLHVSPSGSGTTCVEYTPCSITRAQKKIRDLAPSMHDDIVVSLDGGTYALNAPLTFTKADSGTNGHQVRWEAAPGRTPVLSGGVPIAGWTRGAGNLWTAKAPADLKTRQLYADGVRLTRAGGTAPIDLTQTATGYTAADTSMASWRNPGSLEFVFGDGHGSWSEPRCAVAGISGTAITMRQPCWDNMDLPDGPRGPYGDNPHGGFPTFPTDARPSRIENALELISDGEWYLDDTTHVLHYQAKAGEDPRRMRFTAAKLDGLVRTTTTADAPLHDVTFQGLEFAYSTWLRPASDEGFVELQANVTITGVGGSKSQGLCGYSEPKGTCPYASWTRPDAAVDLTGTKNVKFLGNTFRHLGGAGLGFQHGVAGNLVRGNTFTDISGIGILLGAVDDPQPAENAIASGNTIDNNYLHHTGVEFTGAPSIVNGYSRGTSITHNEIADVPYSGISSGWGGWRTNSTFPDENPNINGDNVISSNLVYRDMLVRYDGGAVYTNGPQGRSYEHGLTVQGNVNFSGAKTANVVYNDEGGDYVTITGNVQYNDTGGFNGGCSTTGHLRRKDNYRVGTMNSFGCAPGPVGVEDLGGNRLIGQNPQAGEVPNAVFAAAGLQGEYRNLTTRRPPVVALASPMCTDDILISGSGFTELSKVTIGGQEVRPVTFVSSNHLAVKLPTGSVGGAVSVTTLAGTSAVDVDATTTLCRGLSTAFGNVGVTSDGNTGPGNVDGFGYTYSAEALATKGVVPGGPVRWQGITYTWPTASPGTPNNALAAGQTVGLIGSSSTLGFLLTSTYATSGTGTVNYTDGTTQDYTVGAPSWAEAPPDGITPVITMPYRNTPNNGRDNRNVYIFAAEVKLDPAKTVKSVKLPVVGSEVGVNVPALHIFAVALADSPNLALHKPAVSSSEAFGGAAARVVDGDTNGVFYNNSVSHTDENQYAWWQVDLGASAPISTVNVWNRTDCCTSRLDDHWTFVSEHPFDTSLTPEQQAAKPGVWSSHHTGPAPVVSVEKPGANGRYVMVQLSKKDYLTLAEVEVYGGKPVPDGDWVGTWGTAQAAPIVGSQGWFTNETIRSVVHTSVGGPAARVRFSNKFGTGPLVLDHTSIALRANATDAAAVEGSVRALTFSGRTGVTIPAGGEVQSDPLDFAVPEDADLLVSTHSSYAAGPVSYHPSAQQTSFLSNAGDFTMDTSGAKFDRKTGSWFYVEEVDVHGSSAKGTVVALGDSITDGGYSTTDANHRWPDYLADRINQLPATSKLGVVNSGISANRVLLDGGELAYGRSALARLDDDVLNRTAVRSVILLEGVNDLHQDPRQPDPEKYIAGYRDLVARMHAKGIKVFGATIMPIKGWGPYNESMEATRGAVNQFIRTGGLFDGVLDFDAALRDPQDPLRLKAEFDSGDHLHPSDAGNAALAAAVDPGVL